MKMHILLYLLISSSVSFASSPSEDMIELDFELGPEVPIFPDPKSKHFEIEVLFQGYEKSGNWQATQKFSADEHTGTQFEAPISYNPHGLTLDDIPPEKLFGPANVIDISEKVKMNSLYQMTEKDVQDWVAKHGAFTNNSILLVNTGWSSRWPDQIKYFGTADLKTGEQMHPGATLDAMKAIVGYRDSHNIHIETVGIDTPSIDYGPSILEEAGRFLASLNICTLEILNNLHLLPPKGAFLTIMPMKIQGGNAAPARVWARLPPKNSY